MTEEKYRMTIPGTGYQVPMGSRFEDERRELAILERVAMESTRRPAEIPNRTSKDLAEIRERFMYH